MVKHLVSFAAVIRVVIRHATLQISGEERCVTSDDPNNGCEGDYKTLGSEKLSKRTCFQLTTEAFSSIFNRE